MDILPRCLDNNGMPSDCYINRKSPPDSASVYDTVEIKPGCVKQYTKTSCYPPSMSAESMNIYGIQEGFSTFNRTIDPKLISNPNIVFNDMSNFKNNDI